MSSISSLTTNFPSLPLVFSASSNIVKSFGQLTTNTSMPRNGRRLFDAILSGFFRPDRIGNPDSAAACAATEGISAAAAHFDEFAAQQPEHFARRFVSLVEPSKMARVVKGRAHGKRLRHLQFAAVNSCFTKLV